MHALSISLLVIAAQVPADLRERERHPIAPSLPLLTKEESAKFEQIIDRCIFADIGKLKGADAKKATDDFNRLGSAAAFELIDGVNRAAELEGNCPVVIIARRLASILQTTEDTELLLFARENIGAGVVAKRHQGVIKELRTMCLFRTAAVQRRVTAQGGKKAVNVMTLAELEKAATKESGAALKNVLTEVERRPGVKAIDVLAAGIGSSEPEVAMLSQTLLVKNLQRQSPNLLKALLRHDRKEVRIAAVQTVGAKKLRLGTELIALLTDSDTDVSQAARRALVQLSGGLDYGPEPATSFGERDEAAGRWRVWWSKQK